MAAAIQSAYQALGAPPPAVAISTRVAFASSAFSEFRPIDPGEDEAAYERNRRIEISVALKDANVRKLIDQYMEATPIDTPPEGDPAAPGATPPGAPAPAAAPPAAPAPAPPSPAPAPAPAAP